ncbi:MAG: glycerate kinase [Bacteroidales bacterium]|nr:glycerate kinase [Bacteroidales bacterium]
MKILIIPDKFKFSFSSLEIADLIKKNIERTISADIETIPISDGGEGFLDAINFRNNYSIIKTNVLNQLFTPIESHFLIKNQTAYIEYAKTGGLQLITESNHNPMFTSSFGLGQQILKAIDIGAKKIIIGLGGSSTNDGGIGMAAALGYVFTDIHGKQLNPTGSNLINIHNITKSELYYKLRDIEFFAATDVSNPLLGINGAAKTYAAQKGANEFEINELEKGMINYVNIIKKTLKTTLNKIKGEGAAGGIGAGITAFLNGKIISGSQFIIDFLKLEQKIKTADVIISGEGKLDNQTFQGKTVGQIYNLTKKHNKKLIIIAGFTEINTKPPNTNIITLFDKQTNIEEAKKMTSKRINEKLKIDYFTGN